MSKKAKGTRNADRKNGKAWKKIKKENTNTGKTVGGYSIQKIELRKQKRLNPIRVTESSDALAVTGDTPTSNALSVSNSNKEGNE